MSSRSDNTDVTRLAVVGTDLKFIRPLLEKLDVTGLFEIRVDEWPKFRVHDEAATTEVLAWADTIVCEWAGPNAVIASREKRPDQRLIVRLHRTELDHPEWEDIDIDAVDLVVTVGLYYRRRVLEVTGWPEEKVVLVPNFVDTAAFDLPKVPGARHRLGMIGAASARKRLDLALDVLRMLREHDDRYELHVKGADPWGLKWVEDRPDEVAYFDDIRSRLENDPLLGDAVTFDPPGPDIPEWLSKIGFLLSTSDDESFHLSPAEGMASRAVPVIRRWPGADEVYDPQWVVDDTEAMAERILEVGSEDETWLRQGEKARREMVTNYDIDDVASLWISRVLSPGHRPMSISLVSTRNPYADPQMMALAASLQSVGHRVEVISRAPATDDVPAGVRTARVELTPRRFSWKWLQQRLRSQGLSDSDVAREMSEAVRASRPDIVYPQRAGDTPIADAADAPVVRQPAWPAPALDLVSLAPRSPALSVSPTTPDPERESLPDWPDYSPTTPERHQGRQAVIAYRVTPTSPGRYLESAMRRAGMDVTTLDGELDWSRVPPDAEFVVIVESAYPGFSTAGTKPRVPVFFWVHHGEHHLAANLRLTSRYQADAVLMAHSWHLAHRFPVPTYRFPFGVAPELDPEPKPWEQRSHDAAMVGSGIGGTGSRYDRRREIVDAIDSAADIASHVAYGMSPEEMIALYGDSRIVINDGGPRHLPITMRVFESLGAGALLLTEDIPGTDTLLHKGTHYVPMEDDVVSQVRSLLADPESSAIADAGHDWVMSRHTYDHRVDRLVELASRTTPEPRHALFTPKSALAALIDQDVDVQQLATFGDVGELGLRDRAIRTGHNRLAENSIDAVAIGRGPVEDLRAAVLAARGYVYSVEEHQAEVSKILREHRPEAQVTLEDGLLRADIGQTPYRMRPADHPLAT